MTTILTVFFIFATTYEIWKGVLNQALIGEGPIYFVEPYLSMIDNGGFKELWTRHDVQALLFFRYFRDLIGKDIDIYMWFLIFCVAIVALVVFYIVRKYSNNILFPFFSSVLVTANFVGSFEMLGIGYYQWFIQRVPNFALALFGFILLIGYIKKKDKKYYVLSLIIYLLSVFLARYTIHILPLFVLFILLNDSRKKLLTKLALASPFIVGSYLLMSAQTLVDGGTFWTFIFDLKTIPKVFYQVTYLTFPFISFVGKLSLDVAVKIINVPVTITYFALAYFAIKRNTKIFPIVISLLISIYGSVYLSIYLNPYFSNGYDTCRYLYYTSILVSLYFGITLGNLFDKSKAIKVLIVIIAIVWYFYNKNLIMLGMNDWQEKHDPVIYSMKYIRKNQDVIKKNSFIKLSKNFGYYATGMMTYLYRDKGFVFFTELDDTVKPKDFIEIKFNK